jgi:hypothetical protein
MDPYKSLSDQIAKDIEQQEVESFLNEMEKVLSDQLKDKFKERPHKTWPEEKLLSLPRNNISFAVEALDALNNTLLTPALNDKKEMVENPITTALVVAANLGVLTALGRVVEGIELATQELLLRRDLEHEICSKRLKTEIDKLKTNFGNCNDACDRLGDQRDNAAEANKTLVDRLAQLEKEKEFLLKLVGAIREEERKKKGNRKKATTLVSEITPSPSMDKTNKHLHYQEAMKLIDGS